MSVWLQCEPIGKSQGCWVSTHFITENRGIITLPFYGVSHGGLSEMIHINGMDSHISIQLEHVGMSTTTLGQQMHPRTVPGHWHSR